MHCITCDIYIKNTKSTFCHSTTLDSMILPQILLSFGALILVWMKLMDFNEWVFIWFLI